MHLLERFYWENGSAGKLLLFVLLFVVLKKQEGYWGNLILIESQYDCEVLQKMFPEQIQAVDLPQVPDNQGNIAATVYTTPREQQ